MKEITLTEDIGTAKKGEVYVQGLHGIPEYYKEHGKPEEFWYWRKGSQKEDNLFLPETVFNPSSDFDTPSTPLEDK